MRSFGGRGFGLRIARICGPLCCFPLWTKVVVIIVVAEMDAVLRGGMRWLCCSKEIVGAVGSK